MVGQQIRSCYQAGPVKARRPRFEPAPRFFAGSDGFALLSASGPIDEVRGYARNRATLVGSCNVFRVDGNGLSRVEVVFASGCAQLPLFPAMLPLGGSECLPGSSTFSSTVAAMTLIPTDAAGSRVAPGLFDALQ